MQKHQDPLHKIYNTLLQESVEDHRSDERDQSGKPSKVVVQPGLHVADVEEVILKNGDIVPGEAEFTAVWNDADYETGPHGRVKTYDEGFLINVKRLYIPTTYSQDQLDEYTGRPGVYTPGMDILPLVTDQEYGNIVEKITDVYNDRSNWGDTGHYQAPPEESDV